MSSPTACSSRPLRVRIDQTTTLSALEVVISKQVVDILNKKYCNHIWVSPTRTPRPKFGPHFPIPYNSRWREPITASPPLRLNELGYPAETCQHQRTQVKILELMQMTLIVERMFEVDL